LSDGLLQFHQVLSIRLLFVIQGAMKILIKLVISPLIFTRDFVLSLWISTPFRGRYGLRLLSVFVSREMLGISLFQDRINVQKYMREREQGRDEEKKRCTIPSLSGNQE
jgi:hypothetical protein